VVVNVTCLVLLYTFHYDPPSTCPLSQQHCNIEDSGCANNSSHEWGCTQQDADRTATWTNICKDKTRRPHAGTAAGETLKTYSFVIGYTPSVNRMLYIFKLINVISAGSCKQRWTSGLHQRRRIASVPDRSLKSAKEVWLLELVGKFRSLLYYTLPQKCYSFDKTWCTIVCVIVTQFWHTLLASRERRLGAANTLIRNECTRTVIPHVILEKNACVHRCNTTFL
jgi:hypothetical protein